MIVNILDILFLVHVLFESYMALLQILPKPILSSWKKNLWIIYVMACRFAVAYTFDYIVFACTCNRVVPVIMKCTVMCIQLTPLKKSLLVSSW